MQARWRVFVMACSLLPGLALAKPSNVLCEPVVVCGCWMGCGEWMPVGPAKPTQKYALVGEPSDDQLLYTRGPSGHLERERAACTEVCPPGPAKISCVRSTAGVCEKHVLPSTKR